MNERIIITAIVGTYRKGGVIDVAVREMLDSAREAGAETETIHLVDTHIEFCANCRACTQGEGRERGPCPIGDDMGAVLDRIERSDAIVLASPMNFGTVTAIMKRFIERLVCFAYWPWGMKAPQVRDERKEKLAVVVGSSAAPAFLARLTTGMVGLLKKSAELLGARTIGVLFVGLAAQRPGQELGERTRKEARRLGKMLASAPRRTAAA